MKEFFQELNIKVNPKRPDIIEKDYHIHRLLQEISKNDYLSNNLVFKGGTCLVKTYTGYNRFSEDLDFTWKDPDLWIDVNPSLVRRKCSNEINTIIEILIQIADVLDFKFKGNKSDMDEVIIGAGGRMARFYLGYNSEVLKVPATIKIEVNFVDRILYPVEDRELHSLIEGIDSDEVRFLFEDQWKTYTSPVYLQCYDIREIYVEKVRAVLTRIKYKFRDVIDIHLIEKQFGFKLGDYTDEIIEKTEFMIGLYKKYHETISVKDLSKEENISESELALLTFDPTDDMMEEIKRIQSQIMEIQKKIKPQ